MSINKETSQNTLMINARSLKAGDRMYFDNCALEYECVEVYKGDDPKVNEMVVARFQHQGRDADGRVHAQFERVMVFEDRDETISVIRAPKTLDIPDMFAAIDFLAFKDTHELLTGGDLRPGMVVLIADRTLREDPEATPGPDVSVHRVARLMETARFCKIVSIDRTDNIVRFVGEYADGSIIPRSYSTAYHWIVIKETK